MNLSVKYSTIRFAFGDFSCSLWCSRCSKKQVKCNKITVRFCKSLSSLESWLYCDMPGVYIHNVKVTVSSVFFFFKICSKNLFLNKYINTFLAIVTQTTFKSLQPLKIFSWIRKGSDLACYLKCSTSNSTVLPNTMAHCLSRTWPRVESAVQFLRSD